MIIKNFNTFLHYRLLEMPKLLTTITQVALESSFKSVIWRMAWSMGKFVSLIFYMLHYLFASFIVPGELIVYENLALEVVYWMFNTNNELHCMVTERLFKNTCWRNLASVVKLRMKEIITFSIIYLLVLQILKENNSNCSGLKNTTTSTRLAKCSYNSKLISPFISSISMNES